MVKHCTGLARVNIIGAAFTRHQRQLTGLRHAVVAVAIGIHKRVIHTVQMDGMRHVMSILEGDLNLIPLLYTNNRGRRAQHWTGL